jgi:SAM-dependent methyltransferase
LHRVGDEFADADVVVRTNGRNVGLVLAGFDGFRHSLEFGKCNADASAGIALSLLHLVEDKQAVIARIHEMLRPGGIFVSNTVCLGDNMKWFRFVGPIGRWLGVFPRVRIFTRNEFEESLASAGFEIEHAWQPDRAVVFIIARRVR